MSDAHTPEFDAGYNAALVDAERAIRDKADRRARTAFTLWLNPIEGARSRGRVAGLDLAGDIVSGLQPASPATQDGTR